MEKQGIARSYSVTLRAERRSAPCCRPDTSLLSAGDLGAEWRLAGKVLAISQQRGKGNTTAVIENTFGLFEISFGVGKTTHKGKIRWNNVGILKKNA